MARYDPTQKQLCTEETYKNHTLRIERRHLQLGRYEFYLSVDGMDVTTATALEREGIEWSRKRTWIPILRHHARTFIDGMVTAEEAN